MGNRAAATPRPPAPSPGRPSTHIPLPDPLRESPIKETQPPLELVLPPLFSKSQSRCCGGRPCWCCCSAEHALPRGGASLPTCVEPGATATTLDETPMRTRVRAAQAGGARTAQATAATRPPNPTMTSSTTRTTATSRWPAGRRPRQPNGLPDGLPGRRPGRPESHRYRRH